TIRAVGNSKQSRSTKRQRELDRRARAAQVQRDQQRKERQRLLLGGGVVVVIVAAIVVGLVFSLRGNRPASKTAEQIVPAAPTTGKVTVQTPPAKVPNKTGIPGVVAYDTKGYPAPGEADKHTLAHDHVTGPVKYA